MITSQTDSWSLDAQFKHYQNIFMILRQVQLGIGCVVLLYIIFDVVRKKQFIFNTTKLFMFSSLCYFVGMFIVLLHLPFFTAGQKYYYDITNDQSQQKRYPLLNDVILLIKTKNGMVPCGLEAFINLFAYNLGYFFAVLITYNVNCVIHGNYRHFMKTVFRKIQVKILLVLMVAIHLIPLILSLIYPSLNPQFTYCYGPSGFKFTGKQGKQQINATLIFYCGLSQTKRNVFGLINIYILPTILFGYHLVLFCLNRKKINQIHRLPDIYLTNKQHFLIHSGKISFVVFIIQGVNLGKSLLLIFTDYPKTTMIINYLFDLYPFVVLFFYIKYNRQRGRKHKNSIIAYTNDQTLIQHQDKKPINTQSITSITQEN